jgi:hypothetical protein
LTQCCFLPDKSLNLLLLNELAGQLPGQFVIITLQRLYPFRVLREGEMACGGTVVRSTLRKIARAGLWAIILDYG